MEKKMKFYDEILYLISLHQEGEYWDFKREWYSNNKEGDLLHDIICMANNLANRDAYIIIGVDENKCYRICDVRLDCNRKNTQNLTDFIRGKKFAGDFRPVVTVEPMVTPDGTIDVIVVHNSLNTPFYLRERFKNVNANNIYVRLQDSNTPIPEGADFYHVEYLWKKRFGMLLTPIEKVKLYLKHPNDWEDSSSYEDKKYYKYAPEFSIERKFESENRREKYDYYLLNQDDPTPYWCVIKVLYNQTVLYETSGVSLNGGRYFTSTPDMATFSIQEDPEGYILYKYMVKGSLKHIIHEFYYEDDGDECRISHDKFENSIIIFEDEQEHQNFKKYAALKWNQKLIELKDISIPYTDEIPEHYIDGFRQKYKNVQILRMMLDDYRFE